MKNIFALLIVFIAGTYSAITQYSIEIQRVNQISNIYEAGTPYIEAKIRVIKNSNIIRANKENVLIIENYRDANGEQRVLDAVKPISISDIISGWQTVRWIPESPDAGDSLYFGNLVYTNEGYSVGSMFYGYPTNFAQVTIFKNIDALALKEINFEEYGNIKVKDTVNYNVGVKINWKYLEKFENIQLDSITFSSNSYKISYFGISGIPSNLKLPVPVQPLTFYDMQLVFSPNKEGAISDFMYFHFNGGQKAIFPIYANSNKYESTSIIKLLHPNGGENFTPCQEVEIKWKNQSANAPVIIYFSPTGDAPWERIATIPSTDSTYIWTVPSTITSKAEIKVVQEFKDTESVPITVGEEPITKITYNKIGDLMTTISIRGSIYEMDLYSSSKPSQTALWHTDTTMARTEATFGVEYLNNDTLIALYVRKNLSGQFLFFMDYFNRESQNPYKTIDFPGRLPYKMILNKARTLLTFVDYNYNPKLTIYNPKDLSIIKVINFDVPILDIAINDLNQKLYVCLYTGEIKELSLIDYSEIKAHDFTNFLLPMFISNSYNDRLLSLGFSNYWGQTDNLIFDLQTNNIADLIRVGGSYMLNHIYSPDSRNLVIGGKYQPQITMYDLTKGQPDEILDSHGNDELTDIKFSPDAHTLTSSSFSSNKNIIVRYIAFPDDDKSDAPFNIIPVDIATPLQNLETVYLGTNNEYIISNVINDGITEVIYHNLRLKHGRNFSLYTNFKESDTLSPKEASLINISYFPLDTGMVRDTIIFTICNIDYKIPLQLKVLPRNIEFIRNPIDYGELCIGDSLTDNDFLIRNNDPLPLLINYLYYLGDDKDFHKSLIWDSIIPANSSLKFSYGFSPQSLGPKKVALFVAHSNQLKLLKSMEMTGVGIGTFVEISHEHILFIDDIKNRTLKIKNIGNTIINLSDISFSKNGFYKNNSQLPMIIKANDSVEIEIEKLQNHKDYIELKLEATPCLVQRTIYLGAYSGRAFLKLPNLSVKATEDVDIPILMDYANIGPKYDGIRYFETTISMNERLFYPLGAVSKFGDAKIVSNSVQNDRRLVTVRIDGDFNGIDTLVTINGVPGLANIDKSDISFESNSKYFGINNNITPTNGTLTIYSDDKTRKILRPEDKLTILSLSPNPATYFIDIELSADEAGTCIAEIYDVFGNLVSKTEFTGLDKGINTRKILVSDLASGTYILKVYGKFSIDLIQFVIIK